MALARLWAGKVFGTSTGNLFVKLEGDDSTLKGTLHFNDAQTGIVVYNVAGAFDGSRLSFGGTSETKKDGMTFGRLETTARLQPTGNLEGEWETDIGSAGTFVLFPHSRSEASVSEASVSGVAMPDQMHTARYSFGPVVIDRDQIIALAEDIQRDFSNSKVVVTFIVGSEQSRYLEDFKQMKFRHGQTAFLKIFAREPDGSGIDRVIIVELGPESNWAMAQSSSESWSLGELEKLKREVRRFERVYATRKLGIGINQLMLIGALVFLPSLMSFRDRAILMGGVLVLTYGVDWLHSRYLPHAAIYLGERTDGWLARFLPSAASWLIGIAASVIATLLGVYLKGWLTLSNP